MSSVLYSAICYIKNDLYRISINVDDNEQNSSTIQSEIDLSDFSATEFAIDKINPSLTRINFELINNRKNTIIPKTIILNHLLSIQKTDILPRNRKDFTISQEAINTYETKTPIIRRSQPVSHVASNTNMSEDPIPPTPTPRRQFNFRRLFSTQTSASTETNLIYRTGININYIEITNLIQWNVKTIKLEVKTEDIANELYVNLNLCLSTLRQRPRRLLAFVNPFGGKGQARNVFEKKVLPIFQEANIDVTSVCTERADQALDYIMNEDIHEYDGLIGVGGDGMFAELCHGLLLRTSCEAQLDIDDPKVKLVRPDLKIGIIPAGSTDAVVYGTTGLNDPITSALQIVVGETLAIDIATVHNEKGFVRFMATMLAYGFFGDIIHQSNKWRRLGPLRYDLAGFYQFISNKSYLCELAITLSPHDSIPTVMTMNHPDSQTTTSAATFDSHQLLNNVNITTDGNNYIDNSTKTTEKITTTSSGLIFCSRNCETCAVQIVYDMNQLHSPVQIKREGRYTTINCLNMPCRCAKSKFGMSPFVHLGDGTFDLILVKRSWYTGFLRFLWQVANDSRSIEDLPNVERYRVSEVIIRPIGSGRRNIGNWACDGEIISGSEIRVRCHRQALNLFASGIQFDKLVAYNSPNTNQNKKFRPIFPS